MAQLYHKTLLCTTLLRHACKAAGAGDIAPGNTLQLHEQNEQNEYSHHSHLLKLKKNPPRMTPKLLLLQGEAMSGLPALMSHIKVSEDVGYL